MLDSVTLLGYVYCTLYICVLLSRLAAGGAAHPSSFHAGQVAGVFLLGRSAMPPRLDVPPELLAEGQYLYEETLTPVLDICARMGVSRSVFYARVLEGKWRRRHYSASEVAAADIENAPAETTPQSEPAADAADTPPVAPAGVTAEQRAALYARAYRAAEQQMDTIECILPCCIQFIHPSNHRRTFGIDYHDVLIAIIELCLHLIEKYRSIHLTLRVAIDSSPLFQLCSYSNRNFVRCLASQPLTNLSVQCCEPHKA